MDLNINLSHWSPDEQLQIQAEQKSYLEQKMDEQFQTLNAEKDKFRLLVMEGRQMLVDERHKTVVEAGRAMKRAAGHADVVSALIAAKADCKNEKDTGDLPIHCAHAHPEVLEVLLNHYLKALHEL